MPELRVNLIRGDRVNSKTDYRDALPVNMYAVQREILGSTGYMISWPGITTLTTGQGLDRGAVYNERQEKHFRVSGGKLIQVNANGTTTVLGTIPGAAQVAMPYSFNSQLIIAGGRVFRYASGVFSEITDSDLGNPDDGVWVDNYYFYTDGEYIYHTDVDDETAISPLKFATAEFMPDKSLAVGKTQDNKVIVFGRYTIEYFVNVASENFAFQRVETRAQKIGIVATHAKCESGSGWYFTGGRKNEALGVYALGVGDSAKVSTREIDQLLAQYTEPQLANLRMESLSVADNTFILVHLPGETLCFNETVAAKLGIPAAWSILKTDITGESPYRAINGVFDANQGRWIFGHRYLSDIGYLDDTICTHFGQKVEWLLHTPLLKMETASIDQLEIDTIPGHNITDDATVAVSITYNGLTYGKEWFESYGEPLEYGKRFILRRLGYVPNIIGFKLRGASVSRMAFAGFRVMYG